MSKYVKNLISEHLGERLRGVDDALMVNMIGLDATRTNRLRSELDRRNIQVMVVKNTLAARAVAGTPLAAMFEGLNGSAAICWGADDIVALAKEVTRLARDKRFEPFAATGGVMDGERLSAAQVEQVSKWPSREEQLGMLVGQILGPGATLAAQLIGPGGALAGQIKQSGEETQEDTKEGEGAEAPAGVPS